MAARIVLKTSAFMKFCRLKGWRTAGMAAVALGLDPATLSRVTREHVKPGEKFIAAALAAFPELTFDDIFRVIQDDVADQASRE